jgi:hypothetical protein
LSRVPKEILKAMYDSGKLSISLVGGGHKIKFRHCKLKLVKYSKDAHSFSLATSPGGDDGQPPVAYKRIMLQIDLGGFVESKQQKSYIKTKAPSGTQ